MSMNTEYREWKPEAPIDACMATPSRLQIDRIRDFSDMLHHFRGTSDTLDDLIAIFSVGLVLSRHEGVLKEFEYADWQVPEGVEFPISYGLRLAVLALVVGDEPCISVGILDMGSDAVVAHIQVKPAAGPGNFSVLVRAGPCAEWQPTSATQKFHRTPLQNVPRELDVDLASRHLARLLTIFFRELST